MTAAGKNTLRYAHDNYGFDFEQPFILERLTGKFTINKIWSFIPHYLYDYSFTVIAIVKDEYQDDYNIVKIAPSYIDIELPNKNSVDYKYHPDYYFRKGDFDRDRKAGKDCFIIAQEKKYIIPVKEIKLCDYDFQENERYTNIKMFNNGSIYFTDPNKQGKKQYYSIGNFIYGKYDDIRNCPFKWFDKSGYLTYFRKEELKRKANKLRSEKEKAEYLETDNTSYIEKVRFEFNKLKTYAIGLLAATSNYETLKNISHCFNWSISWILFDIELFEKRTNNKEYASIENSMTAYNNILVKIQKAYKELNGKEETEK